MAPWTPGFYVHPAPSKGGLNSFYSGGPEAWLHLTIFDLGSYLFHSEKYFFLWSLLQQVNSVARKKKSL
jgi:hypothetical protein